VTTVLVVDDEDVLGGSIAVLLNSLGYDVEQANAGGRAMALAERCHPDRHGHLPRR
jgi:DNA-binding response OmpR family regulator